MNTRRSKMVEIIKREGYVSFVNLKEYFPDVSEMTLRRDLDELDQNRQIVRVHGGAKSVNAVVGFSEDVYSNRSIENMDDKMLIANKALKLLNPKETVFLDSGSTATTFSRIMTDNDLKIVTSGLTCALELSRMNKSSVYMLGGQIYGNSLSVNGSLSTKLISDINFDIAFIGSTGYTHGEGFTVNVEDDYVLKKLVISKSKKVVILMDASKVGRNAAYTFARIEDINVLVTDNKLSPEIRKEFIEKGIEIL